MKEAASESVEYKKMSELVNERVYPVLEFSLKKTKYGPALSGLIRDPEDGKRYNVFFPQRFSRVVKDQEELERLNAESLSIKFKGCNNHKSIMLEILSE